MDMIYRSRAWVPRFKWVDDIHEAADLINKPHEDYPMRVTDTERVITELSKKYNSFPISISTYLLHSIHAEVFHDTHHAGQYRKVNVIVGNHVPSTWHRVEEEMKELIFDSQYITNMGDLYTWYFNFETIHPYQDGNGRTGGIIVAAISHLLSPQNGYLAPCQ